MMESLISEMKNINIHYNCESNVNYEGFFVEETNRLFVKIIPIVNFIYFCFKLPENEGNKNLIGRFNLNGKYNNDDRCYRVKIYKIENFYENRTLFKQIILRSYSTVQQNVP